MLIDRFLKQLFRKLCLDLFFCLKQRRDSEIVLNLPFAFIRQPLKLQDIAEVLVFC